MPKGYETREVVNKGPIAQVQTVGFSGPGVQGVRTPNLSQIGQAERDLSAALGSFDAGLSDYLEKRRSEDELAGQMLFAEGKSEAEVIAKGNRYTTAGYMLLKAKSGMNEWFQTKLNDITETDQQLDSPQYRTKLAKDFSEITKNIAGEDEYTRNLISTMAADYFPKLVSQQVKANNEYNKEQTYKSAVQILASEAEKFDPEDTDGKAKEASVRELLNPEILGLRDESLYRQAVAEATLLGLKTGNPTLFNALGVSEEEKVAQIEQTSGMDDGLLSYVLHTESRGKRYDKFGNVLTSPKGAKGEMQVLDKTNADPGYGVVPARDDSLEERARVGRDYLAAMQSKYGNSHLALAAYNAGPGTVDNAIASVGDPRTGSVDFPTFLQALPKETQKYVSGYSEATTAPDSGGQPVIQVIKKTTSAVGSLLQQGFEPKQIESIMSAYNELQSRKTLEFNKDRILFEQALEKDVEANGNVSAAIDTIAAGRDKFNYNDAHANSLAGKVLNAYDRYQKEQEKVLELRQAISTNNMKALAPEKQKQAIEILRKEIIGSISADNTIPQDQKIAVAKQKMAAILVTNDVVDERWKNEIHAALTGDLTQKGQNGTLVVKPEALQAYKDIIDLQRISSPEYAAQYTSGYVADLVDAAKFNDLGGDATGTALISAQSTLIANRGVEKINRPVSNEQVQIAVDTEIDKLNTGIFKSLSRTSATDAWDITDSEIAAAKKNPVLQSQVRSDAVRLMQQYPQLSTEVAVSMAAQRIMRRAELASENVLLYPVGKSLRADMGLANNTQENAVNKAFGEFVKDYGEKMWGPKFNEFRFRSDDAGIIDSVTGFPGAVYESVRDKVRGIPNYLVTVDPTSKMAVFDLYTDKSRSRVFGQRVMIPLAEIGKNYVNKKLTPDNTNYQAILGSLVPSSKSAKTNPAVSKGQPNTAEQLNKLETLK